MNGELFRLSISRLVRKKRSSLLLFLVLFLSFAFAVISLTVTGSIVKTNAEYRYDTYGMWYGAIPDGQSSDETFLRELEWLDELGITKSYGTVRADTSGSTSIGVMDEAFLQIGRIGLQDGRFPESVGEIAMEADLLSALGYDYTIGQEITVTVDINATASVNSDDPDVAEVQSVTVSVERTFTLCGVIREYADLWVRGVSSYYKPPLSSAVITSDAAEELWQSAENIAETLRDSMTEDMGGEGEVESLTLNAVIPQYYFSVLSGRESEVKKQVNEYLNSTRPIGSGVREVTVNTAAFLDGVSEEATEVFYAGLMLAVTVLAVVCIYVIRLQDETRQLAIFRSIGITRRQLCVMLLYETLCLGVPAMIFGVGLGALGTRALLRLALYSGSTPIKVVIKPALLAVAAGSWLAGVLMARLIVFLAALRAPLTGRFHVARKKARRHRSIQKILIASLSVLLCTVVIFTVLESLEPLRSLRYMSSLADYTVTRKGQGYSPNSVFWYSQNNDGFYLYEDFTVSKDAAAPISLIPGVSRAWGWGAEYVSLDFDGIEDIPLAAAVRNGVDVLAPSPDHFLYGVGPYGPDILPVSLVVVDEGDWEGVIDFDIDMEKFRSGDEVLMSFCIGSGGKFIPAANYFTLFEEYEQTGLSVGDTVRITIGTPEVYATTETKVGGIICYTPKSNTDGLMWLTDSYTIVCSEAFLSRLLDSLGEGEAWHEFRQGTPYGYEQVYVYTDRNAEYLSTDAVLAELCVREDLQLDARMREIKQGWIQTDTQSLILLFTCGGSAIFVLLMILGNTLSMEAERRKRDLGILQALGMSKRQLRIKQFGTAIGRGVLAAAFGWLAYGGYLLIWAFREQAARLEESGTSSTVWEIIGRKVTNEIIRYFGTWQVALPLTVICVCLIFVLSLSAARRTFREDLMTKLLDEH